jgi:carbon-monoxide dehydrogenase medium subunit
MASFEYHRPKSITEAVPLLARGRPLGGGTSLTPQRRGLDGAVDLQDLSLDRLEISSAEIVAGATVTLERFAQGCEREAPALCEAARREAALNLRNMATIAGTLVASDGRSPLTTVLLAAGSQVVLEPGEERASLDGLLSRRDETLAGKLIVRVHIPRPTFLGYLQVGRTPADLPIVCAALARWEAPQKSTAALGGFGLRPVLLEELPPALASAAIVAREAYSGAGDAWASAEYRADVAAVLLRRLLEEARTR